jgi:hypothetical protein
VRSQPAPSATATLSDAPSEPSPISGALVSTSPTSSAIACAVANATHRNSHPPTLQRAAVSACPLVQPSRERRASRHRNATAEGEREARSARKRRRPLHLTRNRPASAPDQAPSSAREFELNFSGQAWPSR